jgi:hypothetical protein
VRNGAGRAINLEDELYLPRPSHSLVLTAAGRAARGTTRRLMPVLDGMQPDIMFIGRVLWVLNRSG